MSNTSADAYVTIDPDEFCKLVVVGKEPYYFPVPLSKKASSEDILEKYKDLVKRNLPWTYWMFIYLTPLFNITFSVGDVKILGPFPNPYAPLVHVHTFGPRGRPVFTLGGQRKRFTIVELKAMYPSCVSSTLPADTDVRSAFIAEIELNETIARLSTLLRIPVSILCGVGIGLRTNSVVDGFVVAGAIACTWPITGFHRA
ncbi:hypothetical protein TWF481_008167 [Arthrobotrys musiformis]|uniref:Uncharacterized protein n=1 Tax=Arthrobotrys musiformis TaxID=47236 RepID=A0AAV9W843_9PEZI